MSRLFAGIVAGTLAFGAGSALADQAPSAEIEIPLQQWSAPLLFRPGASAAPHKDKGSGREVNVTPLALTKPMTYVAIEPCRLIDTRGLLLPSPPYPMPAGYGADNSLVAGSYAEYQATWAAHCVIPAGARAVSANITLVNYATDGYLTAYPADVAQPAVATMNWRTTVPPVAGQVAQNAGIVALSADGKMRVYALQFAKMVVDLNGYYAPVETFAPVSGLVATYQSCVSFDWGDLATVGPQVTVTVPASGKVLVTLTAYITTTDAQGAMGFAVTGPAPILPDYGKALFELSNGSAPGGREGSWTGVIGGLTPGSNTFTAKYLYYPLSVAGSAAFEHRQIIVTPMP